MYWSNIDDMNSSQPSVATRILNWWEDIPCFSKVLFITCLLVYTLQLSTLLNFGTFCFSPYFLSHHFQVYRIFTSAFFHANVLHILFNMLALVSLGPSLERACGTFGLIVLTLFFQTVGGLLDFSLSFLSVKSSVPALNSAFPFYSCAIGISGVLFAYLTMETYCYDVISSRSIFGLCTIPSRVYPFVLLLVIQLLWSGASFSGHLCGILAGLLAAWMTPRGWQWLRAMERISVPSLLRSFRCYKVGGSGSDLGGLGSGASASASAGNSNTPTTTTAFVLPPTSVIASSLRGWNPVGSSSSTSQFPGHGRVLGTGLPPTSHSTGASLV